MPETESKKQSKVKEPEPETVVEHDDALEAGYTGVAVDPRPNEDYTVTGQADADFTPQSVKDPNADPRQNMVQLPTVQEGKDRG